MTAESRITQTTGTRAIKASKQLTSSISASAPLKRHVPAPMLKSMKGTFAKSPSTSSSDSSHGKTGLHGGKAISNRKISQGTTDAPEDARLSSSEGSAETTGTEFEASNKLSVECIELDETKRIMDVAEPSRLDPGLQLKDLDVVHSNLAVSWFSVGDIHEFDDYLKTKTDQNPDMTRSKKQKSLAAAAEATVSPGSIPEDINNGYNDESEGAIGRGSNVDTPLQDKRFEDGKVDVEELSLKKSDVIEKNFHKYEDGSALLETSEGTSEANSREGTKHKKVTGNLMGQEGHGIDVFRGWRAIKILLPSLFVLLTVLFCVDNLIEDELRMLPTPT